ncbi:MAG: hypothetical protein ABI921_01515 [Panacibacter sp.]
MKNELQNIISGKGATGTESFIQTAARYLRAGKKAGGKIIPNEFSKEQEATELIQFIETNQLWYAYVLSEENKIGEGAEQKVFLQANGKTVVKINDAIFYLSWIDYFNSLLLHNYYFPDTKYTLLGFLKRASVLYAVVEQPFVQSDSFTNLTDVKIFMEANGFLVKKNNDYYNPETGLILEDLHEGNVLTQNGILYFVDTIFFLSGY